MTLTPQGLFHHTRPRGHGLLQIYHQKHFFPTQLQSIFGLAPLLLGSNWPLAIMTTTGIDTRLHGGFLVSSVDMFKVNTMLVSYTCATAVCSPVVVTMVSVYKIHLMTKYRATFEGAYFP